VSTEARRVLMTADAISGVWTYALELADALAPEGIEVILATMGPLPDDVRLAEARRVSNLELVSTPLKLEWMDDPWNDVAQAGRWLLDLERRYRPDLIHLNGFCHGTLPTQAKRLVVGHSCRLSWWQAVKGAPAPVGFEEYRVRVRRGLFGADLVVAPSMAALRSLQQQYGSFYGGRVIPHAIRQERFWPGKKQPMIIGGARPWDPAENTAALIRVRGSLPWRMYLAGPIAAPGGEPVPVDRLVALGPLSRGELAAWLSVSAIYAAPSRHDPSGLAVLEAALSGCALVLGDIPSTRELWRDAAELVPPGDAKTLAATLLRLIADPIALLNRQRVARTRALMNLPEEMGRAYAALYRQLVLDPLKGRRLA
jgi:glycosyltransferase involved in cell wall biosynthesis